MTSQADIALFTKKAEAVSAVVKQMADLDPVLSYAVDLAKEQGGEVLAAIGWEDEVIEKLAPLCEEAGLRLVTEGLREHVTGFQVGLTKANWGIAETGTLVIDSNSEELRIATMLSETHVAVVQRADIKPNLESLHDEIKELMARRPNYLAFISGASRTADIELNLTIGAHGPVEEHIIILGE